MMNQQTKADQVPVISNFFIHNPMTCGHTRDSSEKIDVRQGMQRYLK
jgi:hypothetical protein